MSTHNYARFLLRLRYNPLGEWVNSAIKAAFPGMWMRMRDTAIEGHKPVQPAPARARRVLWPSAHRRRAAALAGKDRDKWVKTFEKSLKS